MNRGKFVRLSKAQISLRNSVYTVITDQKDKVCVGVVSGAHGIRGCIKIHTHLEDPSTIAHYSPLLLETGAALSHLKILRINGNSVIASCELSQDRDEALKLCGIKIYILKDQLPELIANTYYHCDLIGLFVKSEKGETVGTVRSVHDYGAGPLLEIEALHGGSALIPFRCEAVPSVNIPDGYLTVQSTYLNDFWANS